MNLINNNRIPPIGMRIIKSAIGVFLCYIVDLFRNGQGIVFYSQLAVLWCMQDYTSETLAKAKQRIIGTFIGAVYGLILLVFGAYVSIKNQTINYLVWSFLMSVFVIVILYTTVVIKKKDASYFSCVVFLSIVVIHMSDINPYIFVWNRFFDTMIGIGLGVAVNIFSLPRRHNNNILFVSGLDDTLLSSDDNLSGYSRVELNRMIESGAKFSVSTMRTPASLIEPLKAIHLNLPVIVMDGAALYDVEQKKYVREYVISYECSEKIIKVFETMHCNYFANVIIDDMLIIYYQDSEEHVYNELISSLRKSPYRNYVKRPLPEGEKVVYFMVLNKTEIIKNLYDKLQEQEFFEGLKFLMYPSDDYPGYSYIKIYNHNATKENMLSYLQERAGVDKIVSFGTIEGKYTHLITPGDSNRVVKQMKKEYEPVSFKTQPIIR